MSGQISIPISYMSVVSMLLVLLLQVLEHFLFGKKNLIKISNQTKENIGTIESLQESILSHIAFWKAAARGLHDKRLGRELEKLEIEISSAGTIAWHMSAYWDEKDKRLQKIGIELKNKIYKKTFNYALWVFVFISISVYIAWGLFSVVSRYIIGNLLIWIISCVFMYFISYVFFYFYTKLYMFIMKFFTRFVYYKSKISMWFTSYAIFKLFLYGNIAITFILTEFTYNYLFLTKYSFVTRIAQYILIITEALSLVVTWLDGIGYIKMFIKKVRHGSE